MLFAKELFKVYPTTELLLAVQSSEMHFSLMKSVKIMEIPKIQAVFAFMFHLYSELEPVGKETKMVFCAENKYLFIIETCYCLDLSSRLNDMIVVISL